MAPGSLAIPAPCFVGRLWNVGSHWFRVALGLSGDLSGLVVELLPSLIVVGARNMWRKKIVRLSSLRDKGE